MNIQKQFLQAAHNNIPSSSAIYTYLDLIVDFGANALELLQPCTKPAIYFSW